MNKAIIYNQFYLVLVSGGVDCIQRRKEVFSRIGYNPIIIKYSKQKVYIKHRKEVLNL